MATSIEIRGNSNDTNLVLTSSGALISESTTIKNNLSLNDLYEIPLNITNGYFKIFKDPRSEEDDYLAFGYVFDKNYTKGTFYLNENLVSEKSNNLVDHWNKLKPGGGIIPSLLNKNTMKVNIIDGNINDINSTLILNFVDNSNNLLFTEFALPFGTIVSEAQPEMRIYLKENILVTFDSNMFKDNSGNTFENTGIGSYKNSGGVKKFFNTIL